jgi:acetylglutamate kinase
MEIIDFDKKLKNKPSKKTNAVEQLLLDKAVTLSEALPYIKTFAGEIFVIKFGGNAMGDPDIVHEFAKDIVLLKKIGINPVIVHGGGPQIGEMLAKLKIKSKFIDGLRVTDKETVEIVEMVLSGLINKDLVSAINQQGGLAIGLSGKDANLIKAKKIRRTKKDSNSNIEKILDLGFVGEPVAINPEIFLALDESDVIPVIAPIGVGENGETYNINADTVAGKIAEAVNACKLIMLTDVDGLLDKKGDLISKLSIDEINNLIKKKVIRGGMIPKIETTLNAVSNGVVSAHILNGTVPHILLVEVFTENGAGTMITEG